MAEQIWSELQKGNYESRGRAISDYFRVSPPVDDLMWIKQHLVYAVKFLYVYTTSLDQLPETDVFEALQAVEDCCRFIQTHSANPKDGQTAEKLLYHVLTKALKRGHLSQCVCLAECLAVFLREVGRHDDANVQKIGPAVYRALWNAAIQAEKTKNADAEICIRLRHQAMVHLLLGSRVTDRGQDVATWTIDHYASVITKLKLERACVVKACEDMVSMVDDLCGVITQRLIPGLVVVEESSYIEMYVAMQLHLVSFLLVHNSAAMCPVVVNRLTGFLVSRLTAQSPLVKTIAILHTILPLFFNVLVSLYHFTSSQTASALSCPVVQAVTAVSEAHTHLQKLHSYSPLLVKILHYTIRLALHLPENTEMSIAKVSKFDFGKMPENLEKEVLALHGAVAKFCEAGVRTELVEKKVAFQLHFSRIKVLQFKLQAVATRLERIKELTHALLQDHLPVVYLDLSQMEAAVTARGNALSTQGEVMNTDDLYTLASMSYKFGRMLYYRGFHTESAGFLQMCLDQFQRWLKYPTSEAPANLNLWKKAEMLADCQRRTGLAQTALQTVAKGLFIEPSRLSNAADLWVRCKLDMVKSSPDTTNSRSLWSYVSESGVSSLDADQVLNAELATYKKFRTTPQLLLRAVVDELVTVTTDRPAAHAPALLEKATLLWVARSQEPNMMTAEACCRQAATLLEGMLVDEHPAHCTTLNDLARAYMCCHIVADVDPLELLAVSKRRKSTEKPDVATDGEEVDTEAYHDCCTLDMEHCATKMADRALELWEQVVASDLELEKQQLVTTIEFVSVLADIYRLSHRVSEEYRALVVLIQLVTSGDHPLSYLRVYTDLALLYARLNQPHLALPLVETITTWLQADIPKTCLTTTQYVSFHLAAAETHLQAGQVNLGCEALSKAMKIKNDNFKPNSTDTLTLDARINRMAAIILTLPPSYHEDGHPNCCLDDDVENAFELEVKGTRSISGVMCFMMGEWLVRRKGNNDKVPVNTLNKWSLLDELVTSLHSTGTTCVRLGEASDARFYLQQGLKLAQGFHLPRRFAAFHLALSHLDNVSGRFTDSQSHMNVAFYTLNSADPAPHAAPITPTEEDTDDEMTIKTRPIEISEVLEDAVEASQNVIGSPTARRWKPHAALCWSHLSDCNCWQCADVLGHRLHLLHLAQQAYCLFQQGLHVQAEAFWNLLLQNFDAVTNRARYTLQVLMSLVPNANVNEVTVLKLKKGSQPRENYAQSGFTVNPSMFQRLLVSVCEQLTELAVTQENWELYEQWVSKASDLLSTESYPWMIACHANLAHTLYLRVLPALPAPKVEQKSHFQELCDRMSQLKVSKFTLDEEPKNADADAVNADAVNTPNEAVEKVEPSQNAALSSQKPSSSHAVKATGRSSRKTSQAVDSEVESQTIQTDVSPLISKKKKPAKETPTVIPKSSHKISTRKARSSRSVAPSTPSSKILVPVQYMPMFKTPKNVSSNRRAVLDMLINSDSDEDASSSLKTSKSKKKQTIAAGKNGSAGMKTGQQKSESAANKSKTLITPNVRFDLLSPSGGNKMKTKSPIATLFKASLNRSVAMDMGTENVFDFILSSPEETPLAARGKKKPSKPGRKTRDGRARKTSQKVTPEADIEVKRECSELKDSDCVSNQNAEIVDCQNEELDISNEVSLRDTTAKDCSQLTAKKAMGTRKKGIPKAKPDAKPEVIAKQTRVPTMKLTRSKTAVLETHRDALLSNDDDDDDSLSLSFETSVCMPDEESASEPSLYFIPSPAHRVPSPGLCDMSDTLRSLSGVLHIKHPSYYLGPPLSPGEVILPHMNGALLESVQEEDPLLCQEAVTQLDIPAAWLDEPMEVMRADTEVEPKGKTLRNTRKLKPKRTGRAAQRDTGTEVPRLSTPLPKQLSDDELKSIHEKEAKEKEDQIMATPPQPLAEDLCGHLNRAFALLSHHPTPITYRKVCHAQTLVELARPQPAPWSLAFYLTEAHAVSFRYSALSNISRKIRKLPCDGAADSDSGVQLSRLQQMQKEIAFGQSVTDLKTTMDSLPSDWTVVQVSVLAALGVPCGSLVVTRFTAGEDPIVVQLPGFATTLGQKLLQDFSTILKSNHTTMAVTNKVQWWSERHALNEHIKEVLEDMEGRWLGAWVGLLQGRPDNDEDETRLEEAATVLTKCFQKLLEGPKKAVRGLVSRQLVKLLLRSYHLLDQNLVTSLVCELCHVSVDHDIISELVGRVRKAGKGLNLAVSAHCRPVLLVLDRAVQHLPWESLPSVRGQPLTRVPSVHFLNAHLGALRSDPTSIFSTGVDRKKTFYVLNPDDNLSSTQSAFEAKFKAERGWKGVVGKPPTADEYTAGLTENDLFIFCGHGGGAKFLPGAQLAALRCHAAVLLMGCSSGKLVVDGQLEATGMMLNYFLAGCPCITACLWDVTDKDIDRFLEDLLDRCSKALPGTSLLDCVHQSRDVCRLPYLIGAAPAVYGLPVSLRGAAT